MKLTTRALVIAAASVAALAMAQDGGAASISTGAAYSSQRGTVAFVTLDGRDILGSGVDLAPAARYSVSLFHLDDDLQASGTDVSPLIIAESGKTTATGLTFDLTY
ncbi:MAG: hypothetical protein HC783_01665 [Rhodobacteraceae bacterium]|nr:hypothetical protein [Paracoccaceae bacterium]